MGVAGSGKSAVGAALSARLGITYVDGDALHPASNIAKMSAGIPLDDDDRWPWLERVAAALAGAERPIAVGCSALRRRYRTFLAERAGAPFGIVYLSGSADLIATRLAGRRDHFMPSALLASQLAALEPPGADENAIEIGIDQPLDRLIDAILIAGKTLRP